MTDDELLDGRYRLTRQIGRGGVGEVFEATDERLTRRVAIKIFSGSAADEVARHESEMRLLAQLDHPALVTVYDAGFDAADRPFLVMQLIDGVTLAGELARRGPLPPAEVAALGATVAGGLAYVHGQGIIHRDIKPANVLLGRDGRVHLADFGIARLVDTAGVTRQGDVVGSPAYFAPEQVSGELVGPAADVYSLGLLLLECLTGRREFEGTATEAAMARLGRDPSIPERLPPGWQSLLLGMLSRTPAQRPIASDVAARLSDLASSSSPSSSAAAVVAPASASVEDPNATRVMPPVVLSSPTTRIPVVSAPTTMLGRPEDFVRTSSSGSGSGQRAGIVITIVLLVVLIAGGITAVIVRGNNGPSTASTAWTPGAPAIPKTKVEVAMERLETAVKSVKNQ